MSMHDHPSCMNNLLRVTNIIVWNVLSIFEKQSTAAAVCVRELVLAFAGRICYKNHYSRAGS